MKFVASVAATMAIVVAIVIGTAPVAQANSVISISVGDVMDAANKLSAGHGETVKVAHKTPRRNKAKRRRAKVKKFKKRRNPQVTKRLRKRQVNKRLRKRQKAQRRLYRKRYKRRHRRSRVTIRVYPGYNPYYYNPYYTDPFYYPHYDEPYYAPSRYSCGEIRRMLRRRGYRRIQAHDCTGKVYTFIAYAGHKRYKLRVRSRNASIKTRKRL